MNAYHIIFSNSWIIKVLKMLVNYSREQPTWIHHSIPPNPPIFLHKWPHVKDTIKWSCWWQTTTMTYEQTSYIRGNTLYYSTLIFVNDLKNYQLNWQRKGRRLRRSVGQTGEPLTAARGGLWRTAASRTPRRRCAIIRRLHRCCCLLRAGDRGPMRCSHAP